MLWQILAIATLALCVVSGAPVNNETTTDDGRYSNTDAQQCLNDMVEWCDNMQYPKGDNNVGISMTSVTMADSRGVFRVLCVSDNEGTNCSKNGQPWFACSQDNKFSYKGVTYTKDSSVPSDDNGEICETAEEAFNDLSLRGLVFNNGTLTQEFENGMKNFFESMSNMYHQLAEVRSRLSRMFPDCFPFCQSNFGGMAPRGPSYGFEGQGRGPSSEYEPREEVEIERERE